MRWPGGCFGDLYDWRDGIGPRAKRPVRINVHWGGVTEDNSFGTHEFMNFAELIGADRLCLAQCRLADALRQRRNGWNI